MHRFRNLMVGLARTDLDEQVLCYAAAVARLGTAQQVRFVHVLPGPMAFPLAEGYDQVLEKLQSAVRGHFAGLPEAVQLSFEVLSGPLMDRLLAQAAERETDLFFVGHRQNQPGRRALARRLAMKAPCSIWMVPEGAAPGVRRILVPIDFSDHAADALAVATSLARLLGLPECLALHVYFNEARATYEEYDQVLRGREDDAFRRFLAPINCQGVRVVPAFEEGANVPHVILRAAKKQQADLIVMATRGRSRSAAILLGSTTEDTIIDTPVPLLVVKHFGARLGVLQALLDRRFLRKEGLQWD
jgi:nucleotide-binding universal stress UspA family protein